MEAAVLHVIAPAKVNLHLAVGGRRTDGYHDVTTVLAAIELADELTISPASALSFSCEPDLGIAEEDNLAYRAALALGEAVGRDPRVAIELRKRIPHGAGLGGGSADAAAVLAGLAAMWGLARDDESVLDVARGLGADVAFFLYGGISLFGGRGDRFVRSLPFVELQLVVVGPDERVPTAAAYAAFDRQLQSQPQGPEAIASALASGDYAPVAACLYNNLTEASSGLVVGVSDALAWVRSRPGVMGVAMAGSGSAVFGVCRDESTARDIASQANAWGWWAAATRTVRDGVRVEDEGGVS